MHPVLGLVALALLTAAWIGPLWRPRPLWGPRPLGGSDRPRPRAFGHRGVRGSLPENTMPAFRAALDAGLDGIETDVQRTRDGALVLVHDTEVAGTSAVGAPAPGGSTEPSGRLRVVDATLDQLRAALPDLATLDELLALIRERPGTLLNVELKTLGWGDRGLARAVAAALTASGLGERLLVSSFSPLALARLRRWAPRLRIAYLWVDHPEVPWLLRRPWPAALLHADALHPHHPLVTADAVARWHQRGLPVHTWTVNDPAEVARVVAAGADGVMADAPERLLEALRPAGPSPAPARADARDPTLEERPWPSHGSR